MGKPGSSLGGGEDRTTVEVHCPCCETRLLVDAKTGVVLREDRKKKGAAKASFEGALAEEKERRAASDALFGKALRTQKDQQALIDRKFEEAIRKVAEEPDDVKPPNPFDYD